MIKLVHIVPPPPVELRRALDRVARRVGESAILVNEERNITTLSESHENESVNRSLGISLPSTIIAVDWKVPIIVEKIIVDKFVDPRASILLSGWIVPSSRKGCGLDEAESLLAQIDELSRVQSSWLNTVDCLRSMLRNALERLPPGLRNLLEFRCGRVSVSMVGGNDAIVSIAGKVKIYRLLLDPPMYLDPATNRILITLRSENVSVSPFMKSVYGFYSEDVAKSFIELINALARAAYPFTNPLGSVGCVDAEKVGRDVYVGIALRTDFHGVLSVDSDSIRAFPIIALRSIRWLLIETPTRRKHLLWYRAVNVIRVSPRNGAAPRPRITIPAPANSVIDAVKTILLRDRVGKFIKQFFVARTRGITRLALLSESGTEYSPSTA